MPLSEKEAWHLVWGPGDDCDDFVNLLWNGKFSGRVIASTLYTRQSDCIYIIHQRQMTLIPPPPSTHTHQVFWAAYSFRFWSEEALDICCDTDEADTCCGDSGKIPLSWCGSCSRESEKSDRFILLGSEAWGVLCSLLLDPCGGLWALTDWAWRRVGAKAFS